VDSGPVGLLIQQLTAHRSPLTADSSQPTDHRFLTPDDWNSVADIAVYYGLAPLLFKRLKKSDVRARIPADAWERLRLAYFANAGRNVRLYRELRPVLQCLRSSGIPVIVLKGAFLAEAVCGDIALRHMRDVDLMVPRAELPRAQAVLLDMGGVPAYLEDIEWCCRRNAHLPAVVIRDLVIEIHWTIVTPTGPVRIDAAGLWDRAQPATIAGVEVLALSPEDLLLHLCLHTSHRDGFKVGLRPFSDIAETIRRFRNETDPEVRHGTTEHTENWRVRSEPRPSPDSVLAVASVVDSIPVPGIDWRQVVERAREWGAARYVGLTLHLARSLMDAGVPDDVLERLVPGGIAQRVLEMARESVLTQNGYEEMTPLFDLLGAQSLGDKAKLSWGRVFLSREEMAAKYPASRNSRHLGRYYVLRLRDVTRTFGSYALKRGRSMMRIRGRDRRVLLVNWLKSGKP
jgi:hypothetical protein